MSGVSSSLDSNAAPAPAIVPCSCCLSLPRVSHSASEYEQIEFVLHQISTSKKTP
jgi:hypothetical protein